MQTVYEDPRDKRVRTGKEQVIDDIRMERVRQDKLWGEQNHGPWQWMAILMEEVGELSEASLGSYEEATKNMREEAIQVAAVAAAIVECIDRTGWRKYNVGTDIRRL